MTKAITKNSKKGFTLVELVIVIAILAILAAIAIPVVNSIINTASKNSALSNAETLELAIKNCQADIAARNSEVYNGETEYMPFSGGDKVACKNAALNDSENGHQAITVEEVAGMNAINDALKAVTYNNATFNPFWDNDSNGVVYVCTTPAADGSPAEGDVLTREGVATADNDDDAYNYDVESMTQLAEDDSVEDYEVLVDDLGSSEDEAVGG